MPASSSDVAFDPALSLARQSLYRFAAFSLLDPKAGAWEQLDALRDGELLGAAAALVRDAPEATPASLALGERPLAELDPAPVTCRLPASQAEFNRQYEETFGLLVSNACPPYEMEYIPEKFTFQRSQALADIAGFYRAFGLATSSQHPERADHIVQELEFMATLIDLERRSAADDSPLGKNRVAICRLAQARFLGEHLAWWAPAFARLLTRENPGGYFAAAGVFLSALIPAERAILGVEPPQKTAAPSAVERPEACDGCELVTL